MHIPEIQSELSKRHTAFCDYIAFLSKEEFLLTQDGKWTAGQQLDHIRRAVSLLPLGLSLPGIVRRLIFGKRKIGLPYDALVKRYKDVLEKGGKASGPFIPKSVLFEDRKKISIQLQNSITKINAHLTAYPEDQLDATCLPHPLLGKITLREMMMFTLYHVDHHHALTKQNLEKFKKSDRYGR
jgi:hypothetical protein